MKSPKFTGNHTATFLQLETGIRERTKCSQWGTCCWCSRWAYRSCPRRRRRPWRTWWTERRWTPWPRASLSDSPSPEKGRNGREERARRRSWREGRSAFSPSLVVFGAWLLGEASDEEGHASEEGHMPLTVSPHHWHCLSVSQSRCPVGVLFRHALFMLLVQSSSPLVLYLGWAHGRKNGVTCKLGVWGVYYPQIVRGQLEYKKKWQYYCEEILLLYRNWRIIKWIPWASVDIFVIVAI